MKKILLITLSIFMTVTILEAKRIWDFKHLPDNKKVSDISNTYVLNADDNALPCKLVKGVLLSPAGNFFTGVSKSFSLQKGTFIIRFKLNEFNNWDGILQTHIGFMNKGKPRYMGLGFKRVSSGIFQAYSIPVHDGYKDIMLPQNAMLDDGRYHTIVLTYQDGRAKEGKGAVLYIDGQIIGKSDYDSSKCWNKGIFLLGTTHNKDHAPAIWFERFEYIPEAISANKVQTDIKKNAAESINRNKKTNNLAVNGNFEKLRQDNWLKNWSKCETFSVDKSTSQSGKYSLRYDNKDPGKYVFPESSLNLKPGKRYQFSGWMKVKDIKGPGVGACIAIEYFNSNGKYLGGTYTKKGMKGTDSRWTEFEEVTNSIPEEAARCRLVCFVRQGMTGTAWFDNIVVKPFYDPFFRGITTNTYRNECRSGKVEVKVGVNWESDKGKLNKKLVQLSLGILDSDGQPVASVALDEIKERIATFKVDSSVLQPGKYSLKCYMKVKEKEKTESITCSFIKLDQPVKRRIYIDKHKRLIVKGKPFFPLGTYWSKVTAKELKLYSESPFNCIMPYQMLSKEQMDLIHSYNLKTFYSLKDCFWGSRWCPKEINSMKTENDFLLEKIKTFKNHPALLAWYVNDERPVSMLNRLVKRQNFIKEHDVDHPTWTVLCKLDDISALLPTYDVIGTDPYPIPDMPANVALNWTRTTKGATFNAKAVWMVPQIFNWAAYSKVESERKRFRAPTLLEMRSMAWQCIAAGANGLIFYSWFDMKNLDEMDPFAKRWQEVCHMASEIRKFAPVLLSIDPTPKCTVKATKDIAWRIHSQGCNTYLITVNSANKNMNAEFIFENELKNACVEMGLPTINLSGNVLNVNYSPLEPKIIKISN